MNKKEISEIKKQFNHADSSITKICGCYVDGEKQKLATIDDTFLCLPEEETFKYFEILAKTLSGTVGKNLISMDFPTEQEFGNGTQAFLNKLKESELKDSTLVEEFYDKVIKSFDYVGNYLILLVYAAYDVPGKAEDGEIMDDASDEVYKYILCSLCPVELDKAALSFNSSSASFNARERDWIVGFPVNGFLFPAFNDRSTDLHSILYYAKNGEKLNQTFIDEVLGCERPMSAGSQKESFQALIKESLGEECAFDTVRTIHEKVTEIVEVNKEEPTPVMLDKEDVVRVLEECGVKEESCAKFEKKYDEEIGPKQSLMAANIVNTRAMKVKASGIEIKCPPDLADTLETKIIDGKRCIVIPLDNEATVNGIPVSGGKIEENESEK